jgi:hypothetical protein
VLLEKTLTEDEASKTKWEAKLLNKKTN